MNDIFISYRRDDSAGHAGRLFDGLKDRLGAEHVFMDVTDLRPGQDFAVELEHAVAKADYLLAVIGPRWLDAVDASGGRRIDDPDDFVRREVGAGLAKGASVIPVLVHGATMPRADELPEALRSLARRQAIDLSDQRWDSDLRELVQFLSADSKVATAPRVTEPVATKPAKARGRPVGAIALVALALVVGGSWMAFNASNRNAQIAESTSDAAARSAAADGPAPALAGAPQAVKTAGPQQRFAIALPQVSEVRFRTNRAQVIFTIMGIRQEPRDSNTQVLTFLVRMLNRGPADEAFGSDQFRLIAGDQSIAPTTSLISSTEAMEAKETSLRFVAPTGVVEVALEVRVYTESTRIPIALSARSPIRDDASLDDFGQAKPARIVDTLQHLPAPLAVGQLVEVGNVAYRISAAVIERETVDKASLTLTVRCSAPRGGGGVSFGSYTVRLWIDGVPRAPVNAVNLAVDPGDSKEAGFVFDLVSMPLALEVGILNGGDSVRVPLPLASLTRR
jgi:hypothetical protein